MVSRIRCKGYAVGESLCNSEQSPINSSLGRSGGVPKENTTKHINHSVTLFEKGHSDKTQALIRRKKEQNKRPVGRPEASVTGWLKPRKAGSRSQRLALIHLVKAAILGKGQLWSKKKMLTRETRKSHQVRPDVCKSEIVSWGATQGSLQRSEAYNQRFCTQTRKPLRDECLLVTGNKIPCSGVGGWDRWSLKAIAAVRSRDTLEAGFMLHGSTRFLSPGKQAFG